MLLLDLDIHVYDGTTYTALHSIKTRKENSFHYFVDVRKRSILSLSFLRIFVIFYCVTYLMNP